MRPVALQNVVFLRRCQLHIRVLSLNLNLSITVNPFSALAKVLLGCDESKSLGNAQLNERVFSLLLLGLLEEELSCFLVEAWDHLRWQIGVLGHYESTVEGIDEELVFFVEQLVQNLQQPGGWVLNLAHHRDQLSYDDGPIDLALHLAKFILENLDRSLIHDKVAKTPVI